MYLLYIILAIVILLMMVVIHEFGHYIAGKILGFDITEFSVGFGPKLLQKRLKNGEKFTLRAIPLGGYCAFVDEDGKMQQEEQKTQDPFDDRQTSSTNQAGVVKSSQVSIGSNSEAIGSLTGGESAADTDLANTQTQTGDVKKVQKSFVQQKPWKRLIVLVAGAGFNFVSAIIFTFIYIAVVGFATPSVVQIYTDPNGNAYNPLQLGDQIIAVDGRNIDVMNTYNDVIAKAEKSWIASGGKLEELKVNFTIKRQGNHINIEVQRQQIIQQDTEGNVIVDDNGQPMTYNGFGFSNTSIQQKVGLGTAFANSVPLTFKFSWMVLGSLGGLFTGAVGLTDMTGPFSTIGTMAQVSAANPLNILVLLPLIAANLAIFNLLPIPALDGSKIVFTAIEWIRRKPINRKVENMIHFAGIILLFGFVIFIELLRLLT